MNQVKVGKLPIIASYTCNFISKLLQGDKNMVAFYGLVVKALVSQTRGPVFKTTGWLQGRLSLSSSRGR